MDTLHLHAKCQLFRCRNVGLQPPNHQSLDFAHKFAPRVELLARFLRNFQRLCWSFASRCVFSLVAFGGQTNKLWAFTSMGAFFSQIFNSHQRQNCWSYPKKLEMQKLDGHPLLPWELWWRARLKNVMFLFVRLRLWSLCFRENGNAVNPLIATLKPRR